MRAPLDLIEYSYGAENKSLSLKKRLLSQPVNHRAILALEGSVISAACCHAFFTLTKTEKHSHTHTLTHGHILYTLHIADVSFRPMDSFKKNPVKGLLLDVSHTITSVALLSNLSSKGQT